ncbi:MAG TPA: hypothetical protein VIG72_02665, partial [Pontibacter sp.]
PGYSFAWLFLLQMPMLAYLLAQTWLDKNPKYRRHLTLTEQGVCYRTGFLAKEQEFDWNEVDEVYLKLFSVEFMLKNEERHEISLQNINSDTALQRAKQEIRAVAQQQGIKLTES